MFVGPLLFTLLGDDFFFGVDAGFFLLVLALALSLDEEEEGFGDVDVKLYDDVFQHVMYKRHKIKQVRIRQPITLTWV